MATSQDVVYSALSLKQENNASNQTNSNDLKDVTKELERSTLDEAYTFIDTVEAVAALVEELIDLPTTPPSLYIDLEGVKLSRQGSISILQIHVAPKNKSYLIDVHMLGSSAFNTAGKNGATLKSILESPVIRKAFFDVRNDSDALFSHFNIRLAGVVDIHIMKYATRGFFKKVLTGLSKCIADDLNLPKSQKEECQRIKEQGLKLFAPEKGGNYEVFNERPLRPEIAQYCVQDVRLLPLLYDVYSRRLNGRMWSRITNATFNRIAESQSPSYNGHGKHRAVGPW